jgi:hypothetical protein
MLTVIRDDSSNSMTLLQIPEHLQPINARIHDIKETRSLSGEPTSAERIVNTLVACGAQVVEQYLLIEVEPDRTLRGGLIERHGRAQAVKALVHQQAYAVPI